MTLVICWLMYIILILSLRGKSVVYTRIDTVKRDKNQELAKKLEQLRNI